MWCIFSSYFFAAFFASFLSFPSESVVNSSAFIALTYFFFVVFGYLYSFLLVCMIEKHKRKSMIEEKAGTILQVYIFMLSFFPHLPYYVRSFFYFDAIPVLSSTILFPVYTLGFFCLCFSFTQTQFYLYRYIGTVFIGIVNKAKFIGARRRSLCSHLLLCLVYVWFMVAAYSRCPFSFISFFVRAVQYLSFFLTFFLMAVVSVYFSLAIS